MSDLDKIKSKLLKLRNQKTWNSDPEFSVGDYCGGNMDDAYYGGYNDGQADLAWEILTDLEQLNLEEK